MAVARDGSVLVTWEQASRLHPVVDDGWHCHRVGVTDHTRDDTETQDNNNGIAARMRLVAQKRLRRRVRLVRRPDQPDQHPGHRSHSATT